MMLKRENVKYAIPIALTAAFGTPTKADNNEMAALMKERDTLAQAIREIDSKIRNLGGDGDPERDMNVSAELRHAYCEIRHDDIETADDCIEIHKVAGTEIDGMIEQQALNDRESLRFRRAAQRCYFSWERSLEAFRRCLGEQAEALVARRSD